MPTPQITTGHTQQQDNSLTRNLDQINQQFKERDVAEQAKAAGLRYVDLQKVGINPDVLSAVPQEIALAAQLVPYHRVGKKLRVAMLDPTAAKTAQTINFLRQKYEVELALVTPESLVFAQKNYEQKFYTEEEEVVATNDKNSSTKLADVMVEASQLPEKIAALKSDLALNELHKIVLRLGISDIHLQPEVHGSTVRGRIDGILRTLMQLSEKLTTNIIRQIKHDASLKYNVTNLPQDGKYQFYASERKVDVRVSTFPTVFGESVVLRFLDPNKGIVPLGRLGFRPETQAQLEAAIGAVNGLVLVTGPTGSGKTTTLYSSIDKINDDHKKIITLEDPVEFQLKGVLQSNIDESKGYTFSSGLKAILRQDPDVVLIGEIRDQATAETAVQAALTGHLVFSTLHTNSAADAIPRLLNMGLRPFVLAPALRAVAAQRLVRTLCSHCATPAPITNAEREQLLPTIHHLQSIGHEIDLPAELMAAQGCEKCGQTGFSGMIGVIEIIDNDESIRELIFSNASAGDIKQTAISNGMLTMWQDGVLKVLAGRTTLGELGREVEE